MFKRFSPPNSSCFNNVLCIVFSLIIDEEDNEDDNSICGSQEGDEIPVNSQFTEFVLRRHKSSVKKVTNNN